jgi:nitrite reductase/ring-hydroxylating ferredoxin subunit
MNLSRRALLASVPVGAALGRLLTACVEEERGALDLSGWIVVSISDHPQLDMPGGAAQITRTSELLDVHLIHAARGVYVAAWRICTHGACYLDWQPEREQLACPCHGSTFALDGAPTRGPATAPLRILRAVREADTIYIEPPRLS